MSTPHSMSALTLEEQLTARGLQLSGACDGHSQRPDLLAQCALLNDYTTAEADLLGASMLHVRAQPGQLLIAEDEPGDWMMVLLRGTVDVGKRKVGAGSDEHEPGDTTRLAVLREDGGHRLTLTRLYALVDVHDTPPQPAAERPRHGALAGPHEAHQIHLVASHARNESSTPKNSG